MVEYTLSDFCECVKDLKIVGVIKAWGVQGMYSEWKGGFVCKLVSGKYAYVEGRCDTSGWG